ncbi:hypothetical protein AHiyo1_41020 [Arthrobacter sp. Hiyo1]|nr:hypothetical protein AHiyo1_41020 [Arthrobacter sp. Hiyo1]
MSLRVDDPVVNAEVSALAEYLSQDLHGPRPVIRVLVRHQQLERGHYYPTLVAVEIEEPVGPFRFPGERVKEESSGRKAGGAQCTRVRMRAVQHGAKTHFIRLLINSAKRTEYNAYDGGAHRLLTARRNPGLGSRPGVCSAHAGNQPRICKKLPRTGNKPQYAFESAASPSPPPCRPFQSSRGVRRCSRTPLPC